MNDRLEKLNQHVDFDYTDTIGIKQHKSVFYSL